MNRLESIGEQLINFIDELFKKHPDLTRLEVIAILESVKCVVNCQYTTEYIKKHLFDIFDSRMIGA